MTSLDSQAREARAAEDLDIWKAPEVVHSYITKDRLDPPEQAVLEHLRPRLAGWRMLDLGVGTGRTTGHFAPLVREYIGIDYSPAMIEQCRGPFGHLRNATFLVGDARRLDLPAASIDFLFFSFNGVDSMDRLDRAAVFAELKRVLRDDGVLVFSSHNTRNLRRMYSFQMPRDPRRIRWEYQRYRRIQIANGPASGFEDKEWFIINDGAHDFRMPVFYIRPEVQIAELEAMGFRDVKLFGSRDGAQLPRQALPRYTEPWLHYLCQSASRTV